ncbi:hypothetical protein B0T22DRAFT_35934 [Podospora appendiculata]|uniref:FAD-binding domain-containing protein n=1 Tax=Podospora appendiculata TaxID=314037 RepID=A0AAE0XH04_9PEZI|nr:hypothetical protein B0T22DRAFT_35934 [Podospora appendiculata]
MHVVIAGAGITGLTAGISLRRSGHTVTIYERSSLTNEVGAALSVPPNVMRFLKPWGLDPAAARFVRSPGLHFMSHETLEPIPGLPPVSYEQHTEKWGSPVYFAHRVDLHEALKRLATGEGVGVPVVLHARAEVKSYSPETPSLTLADGAVVEADLIVAADGVHSIGVASILGHANPAQIPGGNKVNLSYRFLIPKADVEADPKTAFFTTGPGAIGGRVYIDHPGKKRMVSYPCRDYTILNFVALIRDENVTSTREDWLAPVDKSEVLEKYSNFNPQLLAVVNKATEVKRWPLLYRAPISTWHKGRFVLAGDAAHPMLPHHAQGGAQGMEDGLALGLVLHGVTEVSQIEARLELFEKIRRNRASAIQVMSNFGFEEKMPDELPEFLEGQPVPASPSAILEYGYMHDVVKRTVQTMTEFDPAWSLPEGFFNKT